MGGLCTGVGNKEVLAVKQASTSVKLIPYEMQAARNKQLFASYSPLYISLLTFAPLILH
jgi:hypothetical protein